jgi:hypothetical protein
MDSANNTNAMSNESCMAILDNLFASETRFGIAALPAIQMVLTQFKDHGNKRFVPVMLNGMIDMANTKHVAKIMLAIVGNARIEGKVKGEFDIAKKSKKEAFTWDEYALSVLHLAVIEGKGFRDAALLESLFPVVKKEESADKPVMDFAKFAEKHVAKAESDYPDMSLADKIAAMTTAYTKADNDRVLAKIESDNVNQAKIQSDNAKVQAAKTNYELADMRIAEARAQVIKSDSDQIANVASLDIQNKTMVRNHNVRKTRAA